MLWIEMNALVDGQPWAIASMTNAASSRPRPIPPEASGCSPGVPAKTKQESEGRRDEVKPRLNWIYVDKNTMQVIASIYKDGGIRAYWAGVLPRILRVAPGTLNPRIFFEVVNHISGQAITWAVLEWMIHLLGKD